MVVDWRSRFRFNTISSLMPFFTNDEPETSWALSLGFF
jgi:hypothetical protein